jgi:hypothetical protein
VAHTDPVTESAPSEGPESDPSTLTKKPPLDLSGEDLFSAPSATAAAAKDRDDARRLQNEIPPHHNG